ncbi:hypothetical protein [Actinomycetospora straminea]|uniref:Sporulation and cell division protein SsgA n=1 Tax=Actinomycetospora straminea TaxID=663607 RepID=A0ABP9ECT7_9PSEU|nr:hypothetical protein [Actinomycetospora straminea]MDD7935399.1 hypothetical protein [Actinomycetospora straminea]
MGLQRVWIETLDGGLVRADQVVEVLAHRTAAFAGKPARWLLDVVLPVGQGAGTAAQWNLGASHRTLAQTSDEPAGAPARLVRLLSELDERDAAGTVTVRRSPDGLDLGFEPFAPSPASDARPSPAPAHT